MSDQIASSRTTRSGHRWRHLEDAEIRELFGALWSPYERTDSAVGDAMRAEIQDEAERRGIADRYGRLK